MIFCFFSFEYLNVSEKRNPGEVLSLLPADINVRMMTGRMDRNILSQELRPIIVAITIGQWIPGHLKHRTNIGPKVLQRAEKVTLLAVDKYNLGEG